MRKILVCFKVVHDLDSVLEDDWLNFSQEEWDIDYAKKVLNCFDESALELALYVSDQARDLHREYEVVALTISDGGAEQFSNNLYAIGYSEVVNIKYDPDSRFNPRAVAHIIAQYVTMSSGFDAIFLGCQAGVGDSGQTAFLLAEILQMPMINMVVDIEPLIEGFRITSQIDDGFRRATVKIPAVYSIGSAKRHTYLRVPTLKEKISAAKNEPCTLTLKELNLDLNCLNQYNDNKILRIYRDQKTRECKWIDGSPDEKAKIIYENYIREKIKI
jgi:electron transfer flavoprotein beta subunit